MKTATMSVLSLCLIAAPCAFAQSDDKSKGGDQSSGQHKTIHGVVAGVTVLGETMVDSQSGRAITAERDYLTVVDADHHRKDSGGQSGQGQQASSNDKKSEGKQDKDVQQTSGGAKDGSGSDRASKRSARVYLVEVTPKTEVCECQKDGKKKCELARLEIGDRVEIEFQPANASHGQSQNENQVGNTRHGRHRMMRGQAIAISILQDDGDHDKGHESSSGQSRDGNKGEQK